jgi:hypothetical protein
MYFGEFIAKQIIFLKKRYVPTLIEVVHQFFGAQNLENTTVGDARLHEGYCGRVRLLD